MSANQAIRIRTRDMLPVHCILAEHQSRETHGIVPCKRTDRGSARVTEVSPVIVRPVPIQQEGNNHECCHHEPQVA